MKLDKSLMSMLMDSIRSYPPEVGGILGSKNGIISEFVLDDGNARQYMCSYVPNTYMLNEQIECWSANDITFVGIFHTHFGGARKLSLGDQAYIKKIMNQMPNNVSRLYFPIIVFPEKEIVFYAAIKYKNRIHIEEECNIQII